MKLKTIFVDNLTVYQVYNDEIHTNIKIRNKLDACLYLNQVIFYSTTDSIILDKNDKKILKHDKALSLLIIDSYCEESGDLLVMWMVVKSTMQKNK